MKTLSIKKTCFLLVLYALSVYGQGILKGTVIDSLTQDKLKGAKIILTGTNFSAVFGNEIALSSQAKSHAEEINTQIRSNIIKNVISGRKLQDMPDENIPVALSRLPGVSINYINSSFLPEINYIGTAYNSNILFNITFLISP